MRTYLSPCSSPLRELIHLFLIKPISSEVLLVATESNPLIQGDLADVRSLYGLHTMSVRTLIDFQQ